MLREALSVSGGRTVLVEGGQEVSAHALVEGADTLSGSLCAAGHRRVLVRSDVAADVLIMLMAAEAARSDLFVVHTSLPEASLDTLAATQRVTAILDRAWGGLCERSTADASLEVVDPRIFLMTSGTTGLPKVAGHTLTSLIGSIKRTISSPTARWLLTYPPTSFAGLQVLLTSVIGGGALIVPPERTPASFVETAERHEITHISGTPTFWRAFMLALGPMGLLPSLRHITLGGETADQAILDRLAARFPQARVVHIYASTEAGSLFHVQDGREGFPAAWLEEGIDGVGLRVREDVLEVRSPRRMFGYVSDHADPVTGDNWISTGDMVRIQGERVHFIGRTDARVNVAGFKVSPEEVEAALLGVPGVAAVRVIGVPSPLTGQALVAEVVGEPQADRDGLPALVIRHARSVLEPYKVPRLIRIVDSLPISLSGKKTRRA
jgi:acyl-CoA synthetase (AMP-forming)/AMP-acid ligase II